MGKKKNKNKKKNKKKKKKKKEGRVGPGPAQTQTARLEAMSQPGLFRPPRPRTATPRPRVVGICPIPAI